MDGEIPGVLLVGRYRRRRGGRRRSPPDDAATGVSRFYLLVSVLLLGLVLLLVNLQVLAIALHPGRFARSIFARGGRANRSVRRDGIWKRTYLSDRGYQGPRDGLSKRQKGGRKTGSAFYLRRHK